jgi:hypothetical protein
MPTFSFNRGPDNAVMMIGAMNTITMIFTNGSSASAAKNVYEETDMRHVLKKCHPGIFVLKPSVPFK